MVCKPHQNRTTMAHGPLTKSRKTTLAIPLTQYRLARKRKVKKMSKRNPRKLTNSKIEIEEAAAPLQLLSSS